MYSLYFNIWFAVINKSNFCVFFILLLLIELYNVPATFELLSFYLYIYYIYIYIHTHTERKILTNVFRVLANNLFK